MKKLAVVFASIVMMLGFTAIPAQAAPLHGCADNSICLYQWVNYGAGKWQSSFFNIGAQGGQCVNLTNPMAYWPNGTQVTDNSGSLVVNATGSYPATTYIRIFDWINCNPSGDYSTFPVHIDSTVSNLTNEPWPGGDDAYHAITSIGIEYLP